MLGSWRRGRGASERGGEEDGWSGNRREEDKEDRDEEGVGRAREEKGLS